MGRQLAELAGEAPRWHAALAPDGPDDLLPSVLAHLADPEAGLIVDEMAFLYKGTKSVGVAPRYCGIADKIANGQMGGFLA